MSVLHVIPSLAVQRGGPSQAAIQMVQQLRRQQVQAEIVATNDDGPGLLNVPLDHWTVEHQVPVHYFPRYSPAQAGLREFAFSAGLTAWLNRNIRNYDLVHIHAVFSYPSLAAMAIARAQGVPYILRPLGSLCQWSLQQSPRKKRVYLRLARPLLNQAAALHFTSAAEAREANSLGLQSESFVLPLGLTLPSPQLLPRPRLKQQLSNDCQRPRLLFLSRIHPKKGLEVLFQALAALPHRNFDLAIAGSGDPAYCQRLRAMVERLSLQDRVHWHGFVEGNAKQQLLQGADCFVLPSHSENFGIAVLEALAAGLPVVTTPGVALAESLQPHQVGWVIPPVPECWTDCLAKVLAQIDQEPEQWTALGDRARQLVQAQFTWPPLTRQLIHHYHHYAGLPHHVGFHHPSSADLQRRSQSVPQPSGLKLG